MTHDEVTKAIDWASQLLKFSIGIAKEVKGNTDWETRAKNLMTEARTMLAMVHDETTKIIEGSNAAS